MKNVFFATCCFFMITICVTQSEAQTGWQWARNEFSAEGISNVVDYYGNSYVLGWFGPGIEILGTDTLNKCGSDEAILVMKYNRGGNRLWAISSEKSRAIPYSITIDKYANVYVVGVYEDSITFGTHQLHAPGINFKYFVSKINTVGTVVWAKDLGSAYTEDTGSIGNHAEITTDTAGNILLTCSFINNPVIGSFTLTNNDVSNQSTDIMVAKLDSAGNVIWATSYGGTDNDVPAGISVSPQMNTYLVGNFASGSLTVGSTVLALDTGAIFEASNLFLAKIDETGSPVWAIKPYGSGIYGNTVNDVSTDNADCVYIVGNYADTPFNIQGHTLPFGATNQMNGFVAKFRPSGTLGWIKEMGGPYINPIDIDVDRCTSSIWVVGAINPIGPDTVDGYILNPPPGTIDGVFFVGWHADASLIATSALITGGDDEIGIAVDDSGNVMICADLYESMIVDTDTLTYTFGEPIYLAKYVSGDTCSEYEHALGLTETEASRASRQAEVLVYPNPATDISTLIIEGETCANCTMILTDMAGRQVYEASISGNESIFSVSQLQAGVYMLKITSPDRSQKNQKLVVIR